MIVDVNKGEARPAYAWEIIYSDGSVYTSFTHKWKDIPLDGVLILIIWHEYFAPGLRYKSISAGNDYFLYESPEVWGSSNDYADVEGKDFKRGVWVMDLKMSEVYRLAFEKADL